MLLVVHHTAASDLGLLARPLDGRGVPIERVTRLDRDVATRDGIDGVLLVDGTAPVWDADDAAEPLRDGLRAVVDADLPVLGVGAGAQTLALALGGKVAPRERPEVGFVAVHRTEPGRGDGLAAGWPDGAAALSWHRDEVVRLPDGADQLLIGSDGPTAWRFGSAVAVAFRPDVGADTVATWAGPDGPGRALVTAAGAEPEDLAAEARRRDAFTRAAGLSLLLRWVDGVTSRR